MSKYIVKLTAKNPQDNTTIECDTALEVANYKRIAMAQGYKVEIRKAK